MMCFMISEYIRVSNETIKRGQMCLYHCLSKSAMYKQKKKPLPNHFIGAASSNKVTASINNLLFALEIHLCDFKLLLAEFNVLLFFLKKIIGSRAMLC
jgi:hypothetical protein